MPEKTKKKAMKKTSKKQLTDKDNSRPIIPSNEFDSIVKTILQAPPEPKKKRKDGKK